MEGEGEKRYSTGSGSLVKAVRPVEESLRDFLIGNGVSRRRRRGREPMMMELDGYNEGAWSPNADSSFTLVAAQSFSEKLASSFDDVYLKSKK